MIGKGLFGGGGEEERDSNENPVMAATGIHGRVQFGTTQELLAAATGATNSKMDFTSRVVESFSGFHLDGGGVGDARILGTAKLGEMFLHDFCFNLKCEVNSDVWAHNKCVYCLYIIRSLL